MNELRQFIYLDEYKMYSLSSQLFEGFTEFIVRYSEKSRAEHEGLKGPTGTGRVLADIASAKEGHQERRFLHDYAYSLFEAELFKRESIRDIGSASTPASLQPGSLVKVSG